MQIRDRIKELRRVPASQLRPNPKNWRTHPQEQADALRGVLAEVGIADACIAREMPDGSLMLLDGHLRTETLGGELVPVLVLDVNEEEADKILATLDPLTAMAGLDNSKLENLLDGIEFENEAIKQMMNSLEPIVLPDEPKEIIEDEPQAPPVEPITKPGDLWILNEHRLLCGDSTNNQDVKRLMQNHLWQLAATSPPYNQGNSHSDGFIHTKGGQTSKGVKLYEDAGSDNLSKEDYFQFCIDILSVMAQFADKESNAVAWNVAYNAKSRCDYGRIVFCDKNPFKVQETIIWDKCHAINLPQVNIYSRRCEFVFVMSNSEKYRTSQVYNDCRWNYWQIKSAGSQITGESVEHRAAFPVGLAARMISDFSLSGDIVYEPFLGSGTTLIAAEQLGRKCYGMEISPQYCDVIVKRWETFTGKKAELCRSKTTTG
jgi:DNA modification methylase